MKEKKVLILDASLEVFTEKGYTLATTLEISKRAGVSEMTLFRHFQTKNNLFIESIKQAIGESIVENLVMDIDQTLRDFIRLLMHEKMLMISNHTALIKMLIRETLAHTLPQELAFAKMIYHQVIQKISSYVAHHQIDVDSISFAEMVVGLLLRYAIMEDKPMYHLLNEDEQNKYLNTYLNILNI
ncbi:MAG: helix-turn-helix domain-containing protein [Acholeplasmataceae bacterium]|nr:helix-turn-helix domain-containing protein [Acholeplasmataceae bacterium]